MKALKRVVAGAVKGLLILSFAGAPSAGAHASIANWGYVTGYAVFNSNGAVVFFTDGQRQSTPAPPACNVTTGRWAINNPASISTVLTAISTHRKLWISGSGDCGVDATSETAGYIDLER